MNTLRKLVEEVAYEFAVDGPEGTQETVVDAIVDRIVYADDFTHPLYDANDEEGPFTPEFMNEIDKILGEIPEAKIQLEEENAVLRAENAKYEKLLATLKENVIEGLQDGYWDGVFIPDTAALDELFDNVRNHLGLELPPNEK